MFQKRIPPITIRVEVWLLKTEIKFYFLNSGQIEGQRNDKSPEENVADEVEEADSHVLVGVHKLAGSFVHLVVKDINHNEVTSRETLESAG